MSACSSHVPLPPLHQYIKPTNPLISLYPNPQTNTTLSINKTNQHKKERKTMDLYGSFSTPSDCLHIDDFLDFSNITTDTHHHLPPPQNSPLISHDDANLFFNFPSVPTDEAAELEWLSQFVDDDATSFHSFPATASIGSHSTSFLSNNNNRNDNNEYPKSSLSSNIPCSSAVAGKSRARREGSVTGDGGVRRCSHCASEKTPQWRAGPLGPKTLCNACGVRFKSGRLVPEYRPAASPTFVLTQHSNSHRKVMELRRQKELLRHQQQQQLQQEQCHRHTHNHHDFKVC
ncbi:hypothetical protein AAZX31_07G103700 [Glycine max]|nr:GATA transcription factor 4 isoform X2 [Glycine max]RZC02397.1 GATA transcription factor 2 [Glycine soja]